MAVNFKTLKSFVTAVEAGSLSSAANMLHLAQPALSQQIATLESHFGQKLLLRSNSGVTLTSSGRLLYRRAQLILEQLEHAERELENNKSAVSGVASVGLATYSTASMIATPLLKTVRRLYPDIRLFINDNFGQVFSELVMSGHIDMAVIYAAGPIKGVELQPLMTEELVLVTSSDMVQMGLDGDVPIQALDDMNLLLPSGTHFLRQLIDRACTKEGVVPRISAEIESADTLREAVQAGLGAAILPLAVAQAYAESEPSLSVHRLASAELQPQLYLCVSDHLPMPTHAVVVLEILQELLRAQPQRLPHSP